MTSDAQGLCSHCGGDKSCPACMGRGSVELLGNLFICAICRGTGTCLRCGGTGHVDFGFAKSGDARQTDTRVAQTVPRRTQAM